MEINGITWNDNPTSGTDPSYAPILAIGEISGATYRVDWFVDYSSTSSQVAVELTTFATNVYTPGETIRFEPQNKEWPPNLDSHTGSGDDLEWILVSGASADGGGGASGDFMPLDISTLPELN